MTFVIFLFLFSFLTRLISSQNLRTDLREARSRCLMTKSPCSGPACFLMSWAASSALRWSRQAMMTRARSFSSSPAKAFPIPLLAPVTMTVFPLIVSAGYRSRLWTFCRGNKRRKKSRTPPPTTAAISTAADMKTEPGPRGSGTRSPHGCDGELCIQDTELPGSDYCHTNMSA